MLGLGSWQSDLPELLRPNYKKPIRHVFRDAQRYAMQEQLEWDGWKDINPRSNKELNRRDFVSWVPPWTRPHDFREDPARFILNFRCHNGTEGMPVKSRFHADILSM